MPTGWVDWHGRICPVCCLQEFEFCAAYSPLVRKEHAMEVAIYLVNDWMYREREKLFLLETQSW